MMKSQPSSSQDSRVVERRTSTRLTSHWRSSISKAATLDAAAIAQRLFATALPPPTAYGQRPSDTPDPGLEALVARAYR